MKKYALLMAAALLLCTFTGCSGNNSGTASQAQTEDATSNSAVNGGSMDDESVADDSINISSSEAEENIPTMESTQQTENTDIAPDDSVDSEVSETSLPVIMDKGEFKNGTWMFKAADSEGETKNYLYNVEEDELVKFTPEMEIVDFSGFSVVYKRDNITYIVKNVKTNKEYFTTGDNELIIKGEEDNEFFVDGTMLVVKKDTGFDNPRKWTALFDDNGNFIHEWWDYYQLPYHSEFDRLEWTHYGNGTVVNEYQVYIMNVDMYLQMGYESYPTIPYQDQNVVSVDFGNNAYYVADRALYAYNMTTNVELYETSVGSLYDDKEFGKFYLINSGAALKGEADCIVRNLQTSTDITFPTSEYSQIVPYAISDNLMLFECVGDDDNKYFCLINTNGDRIMEPTLKSEISYLCTTSDGNFVMLADSRNIITINGTTGETSEIKASYLKPVMDRYSDIAIVETHDPVTMIDSYKLVDLRDPANIIDPFAS